LSYLGIKVSGDTVLRVVRRTTIGTVTTPRVLGVDDWAMRKGRVYGTILVDQETGRVVELLPDRTAATVEKWLLDHPGVEIVTRDRSHEYKAGIDAGAPNAIQPEFGIRRYLSKKAVCFQGDETQERYPPMSLLDLFCDVDDFCKTFEPEWQRSQLAAGQRRRKRQPRLSLSEIMTIVIHFHQSHYRDFKHYYTQHVLGHLQDEFPDLVSYNRFVELMARGSVPLLAYLTTKLGCCTGVSFIDATPLRVCHNRRITRHRVFAAFAARGKTSMGWFYGFKLHLVVNDQGDLLAFHLTPGNVDDRAPVPALTKTLLGKLFADKGYISQSLVAQLLARGLHLVTGLRKNMKNQLMLLSDKLLLRRRAIIETVNDQLKNISQIEHSRHRSVDNFVVNLFAALIAYCLQPKKPSLNLSSHSLSVIPN